MVDSVSGTQSADARKGKKVEEAEAPAEGSGLVEHGEGVPRERAEDGGTPPVYPERGQQ
jgi:hypothetical protein